MRLTVLVHLTSHTPLPFTPRKLHQLSVNDREAFVFTSSATPETSLLHLSYSTRSGFFSVASYYRPATLLLQLVTRAEQLPKRHKQSPFTATCFANHSVRSLTSPLPTLRNAIAFPSITLGADSQFPKCQRLQLIWRTAISCVFITCVPSIN